MPAYGACLEMPGNIVLWSAEPIPSDIRLRDPEAFGAPTEAYSGDVLVTGGGTVTVLARHGTERSVVVTGGGAAIVTGQEGAARQIVVTGGGAVTALGTTARAGTTSVTGGGTVTLQVSPSIRVNGGGSVTVEGFRTGGATDTGGFFGRTYRHDQWPERHKGRVRVSGRGDLEVIGEKGAFGEIRITGGGGADVEGDKRYPAQYQALLITALAA